MPSCTSTSRCTLRGEALESASLLSVRLSSGLSALGSSLAEQLLTGLGFHFIRDLRINAPLGAAQHIFTKTSMCSRTGTPNLRTPKM